MRNFVLTSGALFAFVAASLPASAASFNFSVFDVPGAVATYANGINNSGEIVGTTINSSGVQQGFVDNGGSFTYINVPNAAVTTVQGVNNAGTIVGSYLDSGGVTHGFTDVGGTISTFNVSVSGATGTSIMGINSSGQMIGYYSDSSFVQHGFSLVGSTVTTIGPSGATTSSATGVNASGQIVGYTTTGFLDNGGTYTAVTDGTHTQPNGINTAGQIVGDFANTTGEHGFLDIAGVFTTIDAPLGLGSTDVTGLNDSGTMVGYYEDAAGNIDSFIATPAAATPEPSSILLIGAGVLGLGILRRRRSA